MSTRREFLTFAAASGVSAAASRAEEVIGKRTRAPRSARTNIKSVIRRDETTLRFKDYHGSFHMSWGADDKQYVTLNDGFDCCDESSVIYNNHLFAIGGGPRDAVLHDVPGYPKKLMRDTLLRAGEAKKSPWYNAWGTLALDRHIYQFVSTTNHAFAAADGVSWPDTRFIGAKLIYSADTGRTWRNQDGSSPVIWDAYERLSRKTLVFFDEPQGAFSLLSILQMGRSYGANRDGYIYVYSPNGNSQETMNDLAMFRVPKGQLLHRGAYEYFGGLKSSGQAAWVKDITARRVVQSFPRGWVATSPGIPFSWFPSVVYNAPLDVYLMVNWGQGWSPGSDWFGKPSYLGFWVAPNPWGPWTQIHEETAWTPGRDAAARAYQPQIVPKWIAADGKSFWLAWPDFQTTSQESARQADEERKRIVAPTREDELRWIALTRKAKAYYGFNAQRIDLVLA